MMLLSLILGRFNIVLIIYISTLLISICNEAQVHLYFPLALAAMILMILGSKFSIILLMKAG